MEPAQTTGPPPAPKVLDNATGASGADATNTQAASPQGTLLDPASGSFVRGIILDPACAWVSGSFAPAAGSVLGSSGLTTPKHDPLLADNSDDLGSDAVRRTCLRSDDSEEDREDCRHDTLEVLAVDCEQHTCARCKKSWTPSSPSAMSCTDCNGPIF